MYLEQHFFSPWIVPFQYGDCQNQQILDVFSFNQVTSKGLTPLWLLVLFLCSDLPGRGIPGTLLCCVVVLQSDTTGIELPPLHINGNFLWWQQLRETSAWGGSNTARACYLLAEKAGWFDHSHWLLRCGCVGTEGELRAFSQELFHQELATAEICEEDVLFSY